MMDTIQDPDKRRSILGWLRMNLAIGVAAFSLLSGIAGALISGTLRVANTGYQLDDMARTDREARKELDSLHNDMIDVDHRINDANSRLIDARRLRDAELSAIQQRIAVLEAQLRFFADRTSVPAIGNQKK